MAATRVAGHGHYVLTQKGLSDEEGIIEMDDELAPPWIQGERKLIATLLQQAWLELDYKDQKIALEAEEWLLDEEHTDKDEFSVPWICKYLDLDVENVRARVRQRIIDKANQGPLGV